MKYYGCIGTGCKADSLMERIAELEAENAYLSGTITLLSKVQTALIADRVTKAEAAIEQARREEREALKKDEERLDWLEQMANKPGGLLLHDGSETGRTGLGLRSGHIVRSLRAAIDAAKGA